MVVAAEATKTVGFYRELPDIPVYEATREDLVCCLITLRDVLRKMRPTKLIGQAIDMIDRAHVPDNSETMPQLRRPK
jgi:hypothetical protein